MIHWITFDPSRDLARANRSFSAGSGYGVRRVYMHPTNASLVVVEVESPQVYADLDLDVNSGSSVLRRLPRKPGGLGRGITVEQFESIYGPLLAPRLG